MKIIKDLASATLVFAAVAALARSEKEIRKLSGSWRLYTEDITLTTRKSGAATYCWARPRNSAVLSVKQPTIPELVSFGYRISYNFIH